MVESHASTAWDAIKRHGWLAVNLAGMGRSGEVSLDGFNSREARLSATRRRDRRKFALHRCIGHSIVGAFESKKLELLELFTRWIVDKIWFYFFSFSSRLLFSFFQTREISVYVDGGWFSRVNIYGIFIFYPCDRRERTCYKDLLYIFERKTKKGKRSQREKSNSRKRTRYFLWFQSF